MGKDYFFEDEIREVSLERVLQTAIKRAKEGNKRHVKVFLPYPYMVSDIYPGKGKVLETELGTAKVSMRASLRGWIISVEFIKRKVSGTQLSLPFSTPKEQE